MTILIDSSDALMIKMFLFMILSNNGEYDDAQYSLSMTMMVMVNA